MLVKKQAPAVLLLLVLAVVSAFVPTVGYGEPICYDTVDAFDYVVQDGDCSDASDAMAASVDGESISKAASEIVVRITAGWGNCCLLSMCPTGAIPLAISGMPWVSSQ